MGRRRVSACGRRGSPANPAAMQSPAVPNRSSGTARGPFTPRPRIAYNLARGLPLPRDRGRQPMGIIDPMAIGSVAATGVLEFSGGSFLWLLTLALLATTAGAIALSGLQLSRLARLRLPR